MYWFNYELVKGHLCERSGVTQANFSITFTSGAVSGTVSNWSRTITGWWVLEFEAFSDWKVLESLPIVSPCVDRRHCDAAVRRGEDAAADPAGRNGFAGGSVCTSIREVLWRRPSLFPFL